MQRSVLPEPRHNARQFDQHNNCGRSAVEYDERAFWQSRMTGPGQWEPLPDIINVAEFAKELHSAP